MLNLSRDLFSENSDLLENKQILESYLSLLTSMMKENMADLAFEVILNFFGLSFMNINIGTYLVTLLGFIENQMKNENMYNMYLMLE